MRSDKPASSKLKRLCTDFPNLEVLTKSATPGDIQVTHSHASIENKSLGKTVTTFALKGSVVAPTVISIDIERAFARGGKNIRLLTTEVLLRDGAGELAKSKKIRYWTSRNAVFLPPFLTEKVLADRETAAEVLLKIFTESIN